MYSKSDMKVRSFVLPSWDNLFRFFLIVALLSSLILYAGSHATLVGAASNNPMYVSFDGNVTFNSVTFSDDDIIYYDGTTWNMHFDGIDVGLASGPDVNAFETLADPMQALFVFFDDVDILLNGGTLPVTANDIVLFTATTWGSNTAGTFSMYLDGSAVGLETTAERIDSLHRLDDGSLLISTTGNPVVPGVTNVFDEDILKFTPTTPGDYSTGTWSLFLDASAAGLSGDDIDALDVVGNTVYLSTNGPFTAGGVSGDHQDVFSCTISAPNTCAFSSSLYFDSSAFATELALGQNLDAFVHVAGTVNPRLLSFRLQTPATSPTNANSLVFRATFNEEVTGVNAADFAVTGTTATITNVSTVNQSTYDITVSGGNLGVLNGVVGLNLAPAQNITDLDLNALIAAEPAIDETYTVDNVVPTVSSIVRADPDNTSAALVDFTVTFSESVMAVDTGDFSLTTTGVTGATVQSVSGTGATYAVTVNTGTGGGTIRLNIPNGATITDLAGNALTGLPFNSGQVYTIAATGGPDTTGVFRPSNGLLYLKHKNETGFADVEINYGIGGDYPVVGDWDGDGDVTIGIYRNGSFYLRNSNTIGFADIVFPFGQPGDQPVAGDWNGDGVDTIGVYRNGTFMLRNSNTEGNPDMIFGLGVPGDIGIAGDWNGDGLDSTGVFRPSNGLLYLKQKNETGFADIEINYGIGGDHPVTGDWNDDGIDTIGVYRQGVFYLRNSNTIGFADLVFALGVPGDHPIAGNWDGKP